MFEDDALLELSRGLWRGN